MSIPALNWAIQQQAGSPAAKLVLLLIADRADERHSCWPSQNRLADESEQSVKSVQRHIKALVRLGLLRVERREAAGQYRATNRYILPVDETRRQSDAQPETRRQTDELGDKSGQNYTSPVSHEPPVEPSLLNPKVIQAQFDDFWEVYPRKIGKGQARRAWTKAVKDTDPSVILAGAREFYQWCVRDRTETQFIPHPSTWLNGERWLDERRTDPQPASNMQAHLALINGIAYNEHHEVHPDELGADSWT